MRRGGRVLFSGRLRLGGTLRGAATSNPHDSYPYSYSYPYPGARGRGGDADVCGRDVHGRGGLREYAGHADHAGRDRPAEPGSSDAGADDDAPGIAQEQLGAQTGAGPGGKAAIRVDAIVDYLPGRTAAETIAGVDSVTVTAYTGSRTKPYLVPVPGESVTVTDPTGVAALAGIVNALSTATDAPRSCPADIGASGLWLDFHAARPGAPDYLVDDSTTGCGGTSVSVGGVAQPELDEAQTGPILQILYVDWSLTSTSPARPGG